MSIILRTQGGFCNRLRAIVSAVLWAEDLKLNLVIHWPEEPGHMACRIEEILDTRTIPRLTSFHNGYIRNARQVLSHSDMETTLAVHEILPSSEIRIESYSIFHNDLLHKTQRALAILRNIDVITSLKTRLNCVKEGLFNRSVTGIHIRRTDHVKCIEASPLSTFERYLDEADRGNYYLATDDLAVKVALKEKFKKHFIASPIMKLGRGTKEEQINGIIDWLLLQSCSSIVASRGSSFSELAAWRAGIPLTLLGHEPYAT
jgi:hypothetical protein